MVAWVETLEDRVLLSALPVTEDAQALDTLPAAFPLSQTFQLHSRASASKVIFLDFDGHTTSGTLWNQTKTNGAPITTPAYSTEGNSSFTNRELEEIQDIWEQVSDYFSPFDVDVTTQDAGATALAKSSNSDSRYGIRIVIGGRGTDWYGKSIGGVAYVGSFTWDTDTPAYAFSQAFSNPSDVAKVVAHEVGHTLGLNHDGTVGGTPDDEYYKGQGFGETGWAPHMGSAYNKNLAQWSKGEYSGANNLQDDLTVITSQNGFGYRPDDHSNSLSNSTPLTVVGTSLSGSGVIERNTDVDVFSFTTGAGQVSIQVNPAVRGPMLDVLAELYNSSGQRIAFSNPANELDASITVTLEAGTYRLRIDGVGKGNPATDGYSDYGSLGRYTITGTFPANLPTAPPNNNFANRAALIGTSVSISGSNVGATKETGEPNHGGNPGGKSVWWTWTAPASGRVQIDTAGSNFDTILGVYTGGFVSNLTVVAGDDDGGLDNSSLVTFNAVAGTTYQIAVDGYAGNSGSIGLNVNLTPAGSLNDTFANRAALIGTSVSITGSNVGATKETGEPNHGGNAGGKSVWWTWTAPASGKVQIDTAGSNFDTILGVYTGGFVSNLTVVAGDDDDGLGTTSLVIFDAVTGTTYQIAVDGYAGNSGSIGLNVKLTPATPTNSANDNFANRATITGTMATVTGTNVGTTKETGEPNHGGNAGGKSVWWTWTAPVNTRVQIGTAGSDFDTILGVYTGDFVSGLTFVAGDDDGGTGITSLVIFDAVAGTTYQIAVDGYAGNSGEITLKLVAGDEVPTVPFAQWAVAAFWVETFTGDFDGDGRGDIAGFSIQGNWYVGLSRDTNGDGSVDAFTYDYRSSWSLPIVWDTLLVGDFDGDRVDDVAGFSIFGTWFVGLSRDFDGNGVPETFLTQNWATWSIPVVWNTLLVGDFDGDGLDDIAGFSIFGGWFTGLSRDTNADTAADTFISQFRAAWSIPEVWVQLFVGDFDGDGIDDVAGFSIFGGWFTGLSRDTNADTAADTFIEQFRAAWSIPEVWVQLFVGDFDGNGIDDVAGFSIFGGWFTGLSRDTNADTIADTFFEQFRGTWSAGIYWNELFVGDFDGDGVDDVAGFSIYGGWFTGLSRDTNADTAADRFVEQFRGTWSIPAVWARLLVADFSGDGADDIGGFSIFGDWFTGLSRRANTAAATDHFDVYS